MDIAACAWQSVTGGFKRKSNVEASVLRRSVSIYFVENREFFGGGGSIFTSWGRQTTGFRDVVARASDTLVRLRRQNQESDLAHGEIYPTGVNFDKDGVRQNWRGRGGGGVSVRLFVAYRIFRVLR